MPRPTTREALLEAAASEYATLMRALSDFPADHRENIAWQAPIEDQSRNPRDVVAHLHAWHLMTMDWCRSGETGGTPQVPGPGRTWRDTPAINAEIWDQFAATPYTDAVDLLDASHHEIVGLIAEHTQEQLFDRGVYPWTKSTSLGAYFVSATSSHYQWGVKTLKAIRRHA
jgi:hypothetical protein